MIRLDEVNLSKYRPVEDEDFKDLSKYNLKTLFHVFRVDTKHRDFLTEYLFFYCINYKTNEDYRNQFKDQLKSFGTYDAFVNKIMKSNSKYHKHHLAIYFDNSLVDKFGGEFNLAKDIYKNRNNIKPAGIYTDLTSHHLLGLAAISSKKTTLLFIKDSLRKHQLYGKKSKLLYYLTKDIHFRMSEEKYEEKCKKNNFINTLCNTAEKLYKEHNRKIDTF